MTSFKKLLLSIMALFVLSSTLIVLVNAQVPWVVWSQTYGGTDDDALVYLVETFDGGYALAGETNSFDVGEGDFWLVKTNEQGIPEFPSWAPMLLTLIALTVILAVYRKRLPKTLNN